MPKSHKPFFRRLLPVACAALTLLASTGSAQTPPRTRPDPLDPAARVPAVHAPSSLAGYRRLAEQPVGSWREANETVNRIGGWRAYAREASQPAAAAPAASAPAAVPVPSTRAVGPPAATPSTSQERR